MTDKKKHVDHHRINGIDHTKFVVKCFQSRVHKQDLSHAQQSCDHSSRTMPHINYSAATVTLNNGLKMPLLGLGTWRSKPDEVGQAVLSAIQCGYRHIDCAAIYKNEPEIGKALSQVLGKTVDRRDLFITSKLWNTHHDCVKDAVKKTLKDLQLDYLDLYLIHWPISMANTGLDLSGGAPAWKNTEDKNAPIKVQLAKVPLHVTWKKMEELVDEGLVKSIGVSNFNTQSILDLLTYARIKPAVNQVEVHPYFNQDHLIDDVYNLGGIITTAYSPFGSGQQGAPIEDKTIQEIAQKHNKKPSQVIIRWCIQRGVSVIPKSVHEDRIKENSQVFDFELSEEEMRTINALNKNRRLIHLDKETGIHIFT